MDADKTQLTIEQVKKASGGEEQTVVCPRCGAELTVFLSGNTPEERSGQIYCVQCRQLCDYYFN